jgi:lysophospholipase L1-like esterase
MLGRLRKVSRPFGWTGIAFMCLIVAPPSRLLAQAPREHWIGTWATAEVGRPQAPRPPTGPGMPPFMANQCPPAPPTPPAFVHFTNQTLRQIVHTSIGGARARVVFSNTYGTAPLGIGAASVALRDADSGIRPASARPLTFGGRPTFTIPPGALAYSDPVNLAIPQMSDVVIDLYLPGTTDTPAPLSMHPMAVQTGYVSETGNYTGAAKLPVIATTDNWFLIARVEVSAPVAVGGLVTFGDSLTDGTRSTPDTNNRWPDHLVRRMQSQARLLRMGVMNTAISGNRMLSDGAYQSGINALARFDYDVLTQPGVTHVILYEGINDLGIARDNPTPSAEDITAAYQQLIQRAHARGLKIYGGTLTPFYGAPYYSEVGEKKREAVNEWIRTNKAFDAVIDFDRAVRDPNDPKKLVATYEACDHLHFSDAGYKALADAIDLSLFRTDSGPVRSSAAGR